jgi:ubiquinone/menaquinone biosynthesis C-methylase UbiE
MNESPKQPTEFDAYAKEYAELIRDPIREKFAGAGRFFFERKRQVIQEFYNRLGLNTRTLNWLDVGCGQGDLLRAAREDFKSVTGCDPSEQMLGFCPDFAVKHQPSMDRLPFEDSTFDFVTAVCVYHHVPEDRRLALTQEMRRVSKAGGVLCIIEHNPLNPAVRLIVSRTPVDADAHLLRMSQTKQLFRSAETGLLESSYFLLFPEQIHRPFASIERGLSRLPLGGQYAVFAQKPEAKSPGSRAPSS